MDSQPDMPEGQRAPVPAPLPPGRTSRRGTVIGAIALLLVLGGLGGLAWYLTQKNADPAAAGTGGRRGPPATTVGVATAQRTDIPVTLEALGTVTPAATVRVQAQVSGVLKELLFTEGQMVKAGQLLATIDPRQFEMALLQATGQRQRDEAQLENARLTLQRYQTLLSQDSIARQEVDTQAALVKQLEGTINTDRAAEGTARINLGYTRVVAPIAGRVGLRVVDVGNVVSSGDANGIAVITQVSPIDVEFAVPQDQVPAILRETSQGNTMAATALDRTRANVLDTGRFLSLDNQVDVQTGTVRAKARFSNTLLGLFPNQFVNLRLQLRTIKDAVVVPVTAVRFGSGGDYVYVLNPDRTVTARPVKRGQATVDKIQIASGLEAGERVITEGGDRLKDGAKVTLPGDAPAGAASGPGRRRGAASGASAAASDAEGGASRPRRAQRDAASQASGS
ncbi:MAG: efflux RND transporter periplasmic adaptor subunit [Pseudomonadota bacterium]